jgi:hypothetical protein
MGCSSGDRLPHLAAAARLLASAAHITSSAAVKKRSANWRIIREQTSDSRTHVRLYHYHLPAAHHDQKRLQASFRFHAGFTIYGLVV